MSARRPSRLLLAMVVHPADARGQIVRRDVATHTYRAILAPDGRVLARHVKPGAPNPPDRLLHVTPEAVSVGDVAWTEPEWEPFPF